MKLDVSEKERAQIIQGAKAELCRDLLEQHREALDLVTPAQAAGMLDISPSVLHAMGLPKIDLAGNGKTIRYRISDIKQRIETQTIH